MKKRINITCNGVSDEKALDLVQQHISGGKTGENKHGKQYAYCTCFSNTVKQEEFYVFNQGLYNKNGNESFLVIKNETPFTGVIRAPGTNE